ncbi:MULTISPECIES: DUF4386 family protein [unclassified Arthrobacter]|uniref:DUF4386 family protein n=1 Tax=unclassified Arthrobacter TaxID=235627 RepID=UPI001C86468D|nr:DUF4386 family protein [Arthrobacter sp. MAHUQ-56]MBX7444541.1 DUF4386 family protein [Arthrobacter sp. MAHUQ-56]
MTGPGTTASGPSAQHGAQGWQPLYLLAGVGALLFVFLLVAALVLDLLAPPPVHGGEATLLFIADNKPGYVAEQILWILPNILPVLVFTALFVALFTVQKSLALTALIFGGLPWALLLAVPVSSRGSLNLVYLSDRYVAAATDEERQVYATAAEAIIAENNTPAIVGALSAVGILLAGAAMLKGHQADFPRFLAWLGIATGVLGVLSEVLRQALPEFYGGYGVLLWAWFAATGIALVRLSRSAPLAPAGRRIRDFGP